MIWLALFVTLFPSHIEASGMAGTEIMLNLTVAGKGKVEFQAAPPLSTNFHAQIQGPTQLLIPAKIRSSTPAGTYQTYLYAIPEESGPIVAATGAKVKVVVQQTKETTLLSGTAQSHPYWWLIGGIITALSAVLIYFRKNLLAFIHN